MLPFGAHCSIYADDAKIYTINNTVLLQSSLNALAEWSTKWDLDISIEKTSILTLGKHHPKIEFFLNGIPLKQIQVVRDLGVVYTDKLDFSGYITDHGYCG